ncbi:MAG: hypothetical protein WA082_00375 [Candidatus Moraniibacteriota bacterium]
MNQIIRRVTVDRTRTPQAALVATKRQLCVDDNAVKTMPRGEGEEVIVVFFLVSGFWTDPNLEKECALRGLVPVDPYSLAAVNEDDPAFADDHPNVTHWQDAAGNWCYMAFGSFGNERRVSVIRCGYGWDGSFWLAGLHKA